MKQFANELCQVFQGMTDNDKKKASEEFVHLFFNRRDCGNRAMMLGVSDSSFIRDILTTSAIELINDDKNYLIRIKRAKRENDEKIVFSFNEFETDITFEEQEQIKALFGYYEQTDNVNLDSGFHNHRLPSLVIHDNINGFLDNLHENITLLSGKHRFSSVTIWTSNPGSGDLLSSIDDLFIIPCSYLLLTKDSATLLEEDKEHEPHSFWNKFAKKELDNLYLFNFIILNNINDHLFRIFSDIYSLYKEHFHIASGNINLLRRVFFVPCKNDMGESRVDEKLTEEDKAIFGSLSLDIWEIETTWKDIELYSGFLKIISLYNTNSFMESLSKYEESLNGNFMKLDKSIKNALEFVKTDLGTIPEKNSTIVDGIKQLREIQSAKKPNRRISFDTLLSLYDILISFAEKYSPANYKQIVENKENCLSHKVKFTNEKKGLLGISYVEGDKDFGQYLEKEIEVIENLWRHKIPQALAPISLEELCAAEDMCGQIYQQIINSGKECDATIDKLLLYGQNIQRVKACFTSIFNDLQDERKDMTLPKLTLPTYVSILDNLKTRWAEMYQRLDGRNNNSIITSFTQTKKEEEVKFMLIDKMNILLAASTN